MKLRPQIQWSRSPEPGFLFDARTGNVFSLNRTAAIVLAAMDGCKTKDELVERVFLQKGVALDAQKSESNFAMLALSDDLAGFLQLLQSHDLLLY